MYFSRSEKNDLPLRPLPLSFLDRLLGARGKTETCVIHIEGIGRGHAGKSALLHAVKETVLGNFFSSGMQLDLLDPRAVGQELMDVIATSERLQSDGLLPTLETEPLHYILFQGERPRLIFSTHETIGQILSHTTPDSPPEQQQRYQEYLARLRRADVLWCVVPCPPPQPTATEQALYRRDLRLTSAYLREALRLHDPNRLCAVVLGLSKVDALAPTPQKARELLSDEVLQEALDPLITQVSMAANVSAAAIFPWGALGFGCVERKADTPTAGISKDGKPVPVDDQEREWIRPKNSNAVPFNVAGVVIWSLLHGIQVQEVECRDGDEPQLVRIAKHLEDDLQALKPWMLTVKSPALALRALRA